MMSAAYSRALILMVLFVLTFAVHAWTSQGHWRCHQKPRESKKPLAAWEEESKWTIADRFHGILHAMEQCRSTKALPTMSLMRARLSRRVVVMKCHCQRRLVAFAICAEAKEQGLLRASLSLCILSSILNFLLVMERWLWCNLREGAIYV